MPYAAPPEPLSAIEPSKQAVNICTLHQSPELWQCCRLIVWDITAAELCSASCMVQPELPQVLLAATPHRLLQI